MNMLQVQVLILLTTALVIHCSLCEVSEVLVESGSIAVLPCVMQSLSDNSAIIWKKIRDGEERTVWRRSKSGLEFRAAGKDLDVRCPHPNFGKANFSLNIMNTRVEDAGMYRCVVDDNIKHVMLRVVKVSHTPVEVFEDERVTLDCSITPKPINLNTKWELNGSLKTQSQTYTISKVSQRDSGSWSCMIQYNGIQLMVSDNLQVKGILTPKNNSAVVYAELGSTAKLPCIFSNGLLNSTWKRISDVTRQFVYLPPSFSQSAVQQDVSAFIRNVDVTDEGIYRCSGQLQRNDGRLVMTVRNVQLVTAQVRSSKSKGRLTLTCHVSDASQIENYEWLRISNGVNGSQTLSSYKRSTSKVVTITDGKHFTGWVCNFYSKERLLGNATYYPSMMSGLKEKKETGSGTKVAMVIGLGFLILILVLILFQIHKNRRRRKMILRCSAMETIIHEASNEREFKARNQAKEEAKNAACGYSPTSVCVSVEQ